MSKYPEKLSQHFKKKRNGLSLVIAGVVALLPAYANASESPKLFYKNASFVIDSCQESKAANGDKFLKGCNFFVRNAADAAMEVYDKDNKLIRSEPLAGARNSSSLPEAAFTDAYYKTIGWVTSEYSLGDIRNPGASLIPLRKTTIDNIPIPQGGRMVVTQNSQMARVYNYIQMGAELASKVIKVDKILSHVLNVPAATAKYGLVVYDSNDTVGFSIKLASTFIEVAFDSLKNSPELLAQLTPDLENAVLAIKKWSTAAELGLYYINITKTIKYLDIALKQDLSFTVNNEIATPRLIPIKRFSDLDGFPLIVLTELEKEAELSLYPKKVASLNEPDVFGADDDLDRNEFLASLRHLMVRNKYGVTYDITKYYNELKAASPSLDITTTPISYAQAYSLVDAALLSAFGTYKSCASQDDKFFVTRMIKIAKHESGFKSSSSQIAKNLYLSGIIQSNQEENGTMKRWQSLPLYQWLYEAIKRGNAKCTA
jgi:hypothetical protein